MNKAEIIFQEELPDFEPYEGVSKTDTLRVMEEYGKHMWNEALYCVAKNATIILGPGYSPIIDTESILKYKK